MGMWRITKQGPKQLTATTLKEQELLEEHLEDWVVSNNELLEEHLLIIGRQVLIPDIGDRIDVLALDAQGNAVIIELKRGKLKDPVDMQALRYASYIDKWQFEDFERQARAHLNTGGEPDFNFNDLYEQFCSDAGVDEVPDLNTDQRVIIVGAEVKAKLGSVALWLRKHNIDIKVVEMQLFREGDALFMQPQTVVPVPVGRFTDTGRPKPGEGARPWLQDGKTWHLDKRCSPQTRDMLLRLDDLIRDNFDVDGPRWGQKFYVAYRIGNRNCLSVETRTSMLRLMINVRAGAFDQEDVAQRLGIQVFDKDDSLADKIGLPTSVLVQNRSDNRDRVVIRLKEDFDLHSETFLSFLQDAYNAFPS